MSFLLLRSSLDDDPTLVDDQNPESFDEEVNTHLSLLARRQVCQSLLDQLFMHPMEPEHDRVFAETDRVYRFYADDDPLVINKKRLFSGVRLPPGDILDTCYAGLQRLWDEFLFLSEDDHACDFTVVKESRTFRTFETTVVALQSVELDDIVGDTQREVAFWVGVHNLLVVHSAILLEERGARLFARPRTKFAYQIGGESFSLDDIEYGVLRGDRSPATSDVSQGNNKDDAAASESASRFWPKGESFDAKRECVMSSQELRTRLPFALVTNRPVPIGTGRTANSSIGFHSLIPVLDESISARDQLSECLYSFRDNGGIRCELGMRDVVAIFVPSFFHRHRADFVEECLDAQGTRNAKSCDLAVVRWLLQTAFPPEEENLERERSLLQEAEGGHRPFVIEYPNMVTMSKAKPHWQPTTIFPEELEPESPNRVKISHTQSELNIRHLASASIKGSNTTESERPRSLQDTPSPKRERKSSFRDVMGAVVSDVKHRANSNLGLVDTTDLPQSDSSGEDES